MTVHSGKGWKLAPSLIALENEANRLAPHRSQASDGSIGDAAHRHRRSDHNPSGGYVHGIDITYDPRDGMDIHALLRQVAARKDQRVEYLISNQQIWERQTGRWRRYTGENPHTHHGHISVRHTAKARNDVGPWFAGTYVPIIIPPPPTHPVPVPQPVIIREEDDMPIYIRNPRDPKEIWVTDYMWKRHIVSMAEYDHAKVIGLTRGVNVGPYDIGVEAFDLIPTQTF